MMINDFTLIVIKPIPCIKFGLPYLLIQIQLSLMSISLIDKHNQMLIVVSFASYVFLSNCLFIKMSFIQKSETSNKIKFNTFFVIDTNCVSVISILWLQSVNDNEVNMQHTWIGDRFCFFLQKVKITLGQLLSNIWVHVGLPH